METINLDDSNDSVTVQGKSIRGILRQGLLTLLAGVTLCSTAVAEKNRFKVVAKDKDGNPVPGVTLTVLSSGKFGAGVTGTAGEGTVSNGLSSMSSGTSVRTVVRKCHQADGTVTAEAFFLAPGAQLPPSDKNCDDHEAGGFPLPAGGETVVNVNVDRYTTELGAAPPAAGMASPRPEAEEYNFVSVELRAFGGASIVNEKAPGTAGFDGAVLFPLGGLVHVGPTVSFHWVNSATTSSIGSMTPGSTFENTGVGFKEGNFGGQIGLNLSGWELGVRGGAIVASAKISEVAGFCGSTGCTSSSTTTHDTVTGPFAGGYISHSIFSHLGIFVEYDFHSAKDTTSGNTTSGPQTVFDVHENSVVGGIVLFFGGHH